MPAGRNLPPAGVARGATAGHLDLAMHPAGQAGKVGWSCSSADIPDVQALAASCAYRPVPPGPARDLMAVERFKLDVALSIDGAPVDRAAGVCLGKGEVYRFGGTRDASRPPVRGTVGVRPIQGGQVEILSDLEGGILRQPIHPKLHAFPGQTATIQVGEKAGGGHPADRTVKLDVTATPGCA